MEKPKNNFQLIYGVALVLAGLGVFYRIPQVMPKIVAMEQFSSTKPFLYVCFYLIGIILVGGGIKKIRKHIKDAKG
jgi:hypothetical protein